MEKKSNMISFFRIMFTYCVIFAHLDGHFPLFQQMGVQCGWYLCVDFFFIVTGYLLYQTYINNPARYKSGPAYSWSRIKKIGPAYVISYVPILIFWIFQRGIGETVYYFCFRFLEFIGLHGIGLNEGWTNLNNSTWFISLMIISGFIIYHCLVKWHDNFVNFVAPIITMVLISYIYRYRGVLSATMDVEGFYGNFGLFRCFSEMCLGIYAYKITALIKEKGLKTLGFRITGTLLLVFVWAASFVKSYSKRDFMYLVFEVVGIAFCFLPSGSRFLSSKLIQKWAALTMYMYLAHMFFVDYVFPTFIMIPESMSGKAIVFLACAIAVTAGGWLLKVVTDAIMKVCYNHFITQKEGA